MPSNPCIICVAITGSLPSKKDNPAVPITIAEQVESTQAAFEAGASIAHCHVRNDDGSRSADPQRFGLLLEGLRKHCPGMIIQFSTGGGSSKGATRGEMLKVGPDMASLSTGSSTFPKGVFENPPELIDSLAAQMKSLGITPEVEIFDLSHLHNAVKMHRDGRIAGKLYVQFVMGIKNAMPLDRDVFDFYVASVKRLAPDAQWCGAGIGAAQFVMNEWCVASGGHARTGLEDNVRLDKHTLAPSNAALVQKVVSLCKQHDRPVATTQEARKILGLI